MPSPGEIITTLATGVALGTVSTFCPPLAATAIVATATTGFTAAVVGKETGDEKLEKFGESLMEGALLAI